MPEITVKVHSYAATCKILPELSVSALISGRGFFITIGWLFSFAQVTVDFGDEAKRFMA
jgi:hypothetical protein